MPRFNLNLLAALDALLTEQHVTKAAEAINVSQPTMSGSLQRLRYQFGDELLVRVGRHMELTPFAARLVTPVREALLNIDLLAQAVPEFEPRTSTRSFIVMVSDYFATTFLPRVVRRLIDEAPEMHVDIQTIDNPISKLSRGEVDLCITTDNWQLLQAEEPKDLLRSDILFSDDFVCIVDADHPISNAPPLDEYFSFPHVQVKVDSHSVTPEEVSTQNCMPKYRPNFSVSGFTSIPYLVTGSNLIGVVQRRLAETLEGHLSLRMFEPPTQIEPIRETLIWHTRNTEDPAHEWLRSLIMDEAQLENSGADVIRIPLTA